MAAISVHLTRGCVYQVRFGVSAECGILPGTYLPLPSIHTGRSSGSGDKGLTVSSVIAFLLFCFVLLVQFPEVLDVIPVRGEKLL